jgi:hypothetical protein
MGLKIVCPVEYQRVKKVSLTAMPFRGAGGAKLGLWFNDVDNGLDKPIS